MWNKTTTRVIGAVCALVLLLCPLTTAGAYMADPVELTVRAESGDHDPYVSGYSGGVFKPDATVSRAEAAQMLYRLLAETPEDRIAFADAQPGAWYYDAVGLLAAAGVISWRGVQIGPDEALTRGELASMVVRLFPAGETVREDAAFTDVDQRHPYAKEIALACAYGWVSGYGDGQFRPDRTVTRAEAVTIINRALGRTPDRDAVDDIVLPLFRDVPAGYWAYDQVMEAALGHRHDPETGLWSWMDTAALQKPGGLYFDGLELYYIDPATGLAEADVTREGLYFGPDGRYTSGDGELDGYVKTALQGVVHDGMTQEQKLHAAYNYARDSFTYLRRNYYEMGDTSWGVQEAKTMFTTKRGNCYCYAAVFCFLARQLGYDAQLISGKVNTYNPVPHAWVEIAFNGENFMYDCELEMSYRVRGVYRYDFYHMAYDDVPWRYWR